VVWTAGARRAVRVEQQDCGFVGWRISCADGFEQMLKVDCSGARIRMSERRLPVFRLLDCYVVSLYEFDALRVISDRYGAKRHQASDPSGTLVPDASG
jgi:hypothetical protein